VSKLSRKPADDDINLDDMLAEMPSSPSTNGGSTVDDLSELDSILDGVESSKPPHKKPATPAKSGVTAPKPATARASSAPKPAAPPPPPPDMLSPEAEMAMGGISIDLQMDGDPSEQELDALESLVANNRPEPPKPP